MQAADIAVALVHRHSSSSLAAAFVMAEAAAAAADTVHALVNERPSSSLDAKHVAARVGRPADTAHFELDCFHGENVAGTAKSPAATEAAELAAASTAASGLAETETCHYARRFGPAHGVEAADTSVLAPVDRAVAAGGTALAPAVLATLVGHVERADLESAAVVAGRVDLEKDSAVAAVVLVVFPVLADTEPALELAHLEFDSAPSASFELHACPVAFVLYAQDR